MTNLAIVGCHSINGVSAMHTELVKTIAGARLLPALAGTIQQQDKWYLAAALAAVGQPAAGRTDQRGDRTRLDHGPRSASGPGAVGGGSGLSGRIPEGEASQQGEARKDHHATTCEPKRTRTHSSTFRPSGFTSTSGNSESPARHHSLYPDQGRPHADLTPRTVSLPGRPLPATLPPSCSSN